MLKRETKRKMRLTDTDNLGGILDADAAAETADNIARQQLANGMIPWFEGGHADPWNHIECAMAVDLAGLHEVSRRAYNWLADIQLPNGAWYQYYLADSVEQDRQDANCTAYIATGIWHHFLCTEDKSVLADFWQVVQNAVNFVLDLQTQRGEIVWARHKDGIPWSFALLTGSSSVHHSLKMALKIAEEMDEPQPEWELASERLGKVIASQPEAFTPKKRWAMDWYYPVLSGAVSGGRRLKHLEAGADVFLDKDFGVKCVSDRNWFTAAETAECTMAYLAAGDREKALNLFATTQNLRCEDGSYYTGLVIPERVNYPADERTTYTSAAVLLAADAISQTSPASEIFLEDFEIHLTR